MIPVGLGTIRTENTLKYIGSATLGGMLYGAIGAAASGRSDHPILKGAVVAGAVGLAMGALVAAVIRSEEPAGQLSGPRGLYFP